MENKVNHLLKFISDIFQDSTFEVIHNSLSPTLKHFIVRDSTGEKGFGSDHDYLIAIEKAYSEFIERKTFHELNRMFNQFKTSNGFAAHLNVSNATIASRNELIERDALLLTWHSKTAPYWIECSEIKNLLTNENLELFLNHNKITLKVKFGIIATCNETITCIVSIQGQYKGKRFFYIDTKAGSNLSILINSLLESISFYSHHIDMGLLKKNSYSVRTPVNPMDHFYYYLNSNVDIGWFDKGSSNVYNIPSSQIRNYSLNPQAILGVKQSLNRKVVYSESESMQSYYCGKFNSKDINTTRFRNIFGKNLIFNKQLHPLS